MIRRGPESQTSPGRAGDPRRVRSAHVEWVADRLSDRDWQIVETVNRLRLVSGNQLERLHFTARSGHARAVIRGRVLRRLVQWHVLTILPRRIGGAARGSAGSVFALGSAGARLWQQRQATTNQPRVRHPGVPTERTVRHTLAVSELYTQLVEHGRVQGAAVVKFEAEPASWWPNGIGGYLKPDAYTLLSQGTVREHWWLEVDLATESLPTLKHKLGTYLDFLARGQLGPAGLMPRVLVTAITPARQVALQALVSRLPTPAAELFVVAAADEAAACLLLSLHE